MTSMQGITTPRFCISSGQPPTERVCLEELREVMVVIGQQKTEPGESGAGEGHLSEQQQMSLAPSGNRLGSHYSH